jgi:hypothetical protein
MSEKEAQEQPVASPIAPLQEQVDNKDTFVDEHGVTRYKATGQIAPGNTANPGGRPKGSYSIMTILRKKMEEIPLGQTKEWAHQVAEIILDEAVVHRKGDMLKLLVQYMDGMPNQKIDLGVDKEEVGTLTEFLQAMAAKKTPTPAPEVSPTSDAKDNQPIEPK